MKRLSKILLAAAVVLVMTMGLSAKADAAEWSGLAVGDDGQWHYYTDGSVDWGYTGMAWNEYGWWYVTNGSIDFSYTGMASNETAGFILVTVHWTGITPEWHATKTAGSILATVC